MALRNPTRAEKREYKEKLQYGQGIDLEPKSKNEIESDQNLKSKSVEGNTERRLSGSNLDFYRRENNRLGSHPDYDDLGEDSFP